ncbi:MAG: DUF5813 family protein [Haloplanus sp.]
MTEVSDRVRRAFRDHGSFERVDAGRYESVTTPFEGVVEAATGDGESVRFDVTVRVPTLSASVDGDVADVVEEGWYETFERRMAGMGGVTGGDHDLSPGVDRRGDEVAVRASFADLNERRGVDDANAVINYVEGTYVQGVIPGYDYTGAVTQLVERARQTGER